MIVLPKLATSACYPSAHTEIHISLIFLPVEADLLEHSQQRQEVVVHSFQFLGSKPSGLPVFSKLCFTLLAVLSNLDLASVICLFLHFQFYLGGFVSWLRTFFYISHLLGLLPKCAVFPGVLSALFTSFGLTASRTFYTNFKFVTLLIKKIRRSNTYLIKELASSTIYSEEDGSSER